MFCLAVVVLKFLLLALDPSPKFYLGDSISYIWTALTGWIPEDRSYFYGFIVRWFALWTGSLTSLLILQTFLGAIIAITTGWVCRAYFGLSAKMAYLFGILCAIDPLQVTWERYLMTEICSLFVYTLVLQQSFAYLRSRKIATLLFIQVLSVLTFGFRTVFLIPVLVMAVALPVIAFCQARLDFLRHRVFWQHLAASVIAMFVLDQAYQRAYGFLTHREPAHLHAAGYFLLAICAPALQPQDATDPRLAKIIEQGDEFGLHNFDLRNEQRFIAGYLVDRWRRAEPNRVKSSKVATATALNTFRRDPVAVAGFAAKTFFILLHPAQMKRFAQWDLGNGILKDKELKFLAERFHWTGRADVASEPQTFVKWYYVAGTPWYLVVMLSPLLALALLILAADKRQAWLLFLHTTILMAATFLFATGPITRYLQPLSLLTLLMFAAAVRSIPPWTQMPGKRISQWLAPVRRWSKRPRPDRSAKLQSPLWPRSICSPVW